MKYGSVCSGIEAATVAWHGLGWEPAWFSEIDKFPCKVLAHHYPNVPNLGDMTKLHEKEEFRGRPIELLVGGTPCQSFSVAGLRKGLADPRGNLALHFLKILDLQRPRWVVWENVPGVLSSWSDEEGSFAADPEGAARALRDGRGGVGGGEWERGWQTNDFDTFLSGLRELGYGVAWRILDAQFFGVAQRRRRVFVVGYLGDWRPAAAVLFERHSLSGDSAPSRKTGERVAEPVTTRIDRGGSHREAHGAGLTYCSDLSPTVASGPPFSRTGNERVEAEAMVVEDVAGTLGNRGLRSHTELDGHGAYIPEIMAHGQANAEIRADGGAPSLTCNHEAPIVSTSMAVRRLTPKECERLQGFPDDYTNIPGAKDGPRYKALGNSMAVPVMAWIGRRIQQTELILQGPQ